MSRQPAGLCLICSAVLALPLVSDASAAGDSAALLATVGKTGKHHHHKHKMWLLAAAAAPPASDPAPSPSPSAEAAAAKVFRPGLGSGPDTVEFGIFVKSIGHISEKDGTFSADIILLLRWQDRRTAALVPDGVTKFTLASKSAGSKIWLPDIAITNRIIKGQEVISSAISITPAGEVTKIERMVVVCKNNFDMRAFPFDAQHLDLTIASTTLMLDELQLSPIQNKKISGLNKGVFDAYDLVLDKVDATSYDEIVGSLQKSRGELSIFLHRDWQLYMQKKLLPELFLVFISWTVFYFPLQPVFAMPRVATSLIAFLSMMTVSGSNNGGGGERWLDVFEEACMTLLFLTVFLNIFVESVDHALDQAAVAIRMDHELKLVLPLLTSVIFTFLLVFNQYDVIWLSLITRIISAASPVAYVAACCMRFPEIKDGAKLFFFKRSSPSAEPGKSGSQP